MKVFVVGRDATCDIVINDSRVSRQHLQLIESNDGACYVIDLGSSNGTIVNGRRIDGKVQLKLGDEVLLGSSKLQWTKYVGNFNLKERNQKEIVIKSKGEEDVLERKMMSTRKHQLLVMLTIIGLLIIGFCAWILVNHSQKERRKEWEEENENQISYWMEGVDVEKAAREAAEEMASFEKQKREDAEVEVEIAREKQKDAELKAFAAKKAKENAEQERRKAQADSRVAKKKRDDAMAQVKKAEAAADAANAAAKKAKDEMQRQEEDFVKELQASFDELMDNVDPEVLEKVEGKLKVSEKEQLEELFKKSNYEKKREIITTIRQEKKAWDKSRAEAEKKARKERKVTNVVDTIQ